MHRILVRKYNANKLVHVEGYNHIDEALQREKCLKAWQRKWKLRLIESNNPKWMNFYNTMM